MDTPFTPLIWPEMPLPPKGESYAACGICRPARIVWGEGNPAASLMIILDNPGAREDEGGNPYVCGTRQTLQEALHRVGLGPEDVFLTYLLKCRPKRTYDRAAVRAFSLPYLLGQIAKMNPAILLCLGDVVAQTLWHNPDAHVKDLRGRWHTLLHRPCLFSYHPLAVRRRPNLLPALGEDMMLLAQAMGRKTKP